MLQTYNKNVATYIQAVWASDQFMRILYPRRIFSLRREYNMQTAWVDTPYFYLLRPFSIERGLPVCARIALWVSYPTRGLITEKKILVQNQENYAFPLLFFLRDDRKRLTYSLGSPLPKNSIVWRPTTNNEVSCHLTRWKDTKPANLNFCFH